MTVTFVTATAEPARAATAYRYWAYYVAHRSSWQYATRGPATEYPVDGEVQGWRFAVQIDSGNGLEPRATPTFATLCASTPPKAGDIRVGVVLDFGLAADAPAHDHPPATVVPGCVSVPSGSTGHRCCWRLPACASAPGRTPGWCVALTAIRRQSAPSPSPCRPTRPGRRHLRREQHRPNARHRSLPPTPSSLPSQLHPPLEPRSRRQPPQRNVHLRRSCRACRRPPRRCPWPGRLWGRCGRSSTTGSRC